MPSTPFPLDSDMPDQPSNGSSIAYVTIPLFYFERLMKAYHGERSSLKGTPAPVPEAPSPRPRPDDDIEITTQGDLLAMMMEDANPLGLNLGGVARRQQAAIEKAARPLKETKRANAGSNTD